MVHNNLGFHLAGQGKTDDAIRHFERALQLRPDFAAAHYNLGSALVAQGRIDEAIRHYEAFVRLSPGNPRGLLQLAAAYAAVGRFPEAAATAREAAAIATDHDLKELAAQMEQRAAAYASGQPYCER